MIEWESVSISWVHTFLGKKKISLLPVGSEMVPVGVGYSVNTTLGWVWLLSGSMEVSISLFFGHSIHGALTLVHCLFVRGMN